MGIIRTRLCVGRYSGESARPRVGGRTDPRRVVRTVRSRPARAPGAVPCDRILAVATARGRARSRSEAVVVSAGRRSTRCPTAWRAGREEAVHSPPAALPSSRFSAPLYCDLDDGRRPPSDAQGPGDRVGRSQAPDAGQLPAGYPIVQFPNAPLILAFAAGLLAHHTF
jgi:hypothetical protein